MRNMNEQNHKKKRKIRIILSAACSLLILTIAVIVIISTPVTAQNQQPCSFERGDANGDGQGDLSDAIFILNYLFKGSTPLGCEDAADANDDGIIDLSDPIYLLNFLFLGSGQEPPGFGALRRDATPDGLTCGGPQFTDTACSRIANDQRCPLGPATSSCFCGTQRIDSGSCCFGRATDSPCEFEVFTDTKFSREGLSKNIIQGVLKEFARPTDPEYQLTQGEDDHPASTTHPILGPVVLWQRHEEGIRKIYGCLLQGTRSSTECETNKQLLSEGDSFHPSTIVTESGLPFAIWETETTIESCIITSGRSRISCSNRQTLVNKENPGPAWPEITGTIRAPIVLWREKVNAEERSLRICSLDEIDENLICEPSEIAVGDISFADALNGVVVWATKMGAVPGTGAPSFTLNRFPSPPAANPLEPPGATLIFPENIPELNGITLFTKPELCQRRVINEEGKVEIGVNMIIKRITSWTKTPSLAQFRTEPNRIWIIGLPTGDNQILDAYQVNFRHDEGAHGPHLVPNPQKECGTVRTKILGAKEEKIVRIGPDGQPQETTTISALEGKTSPFNNRQNELVNCFLGNFQALEVDETLSPNPDCKIKKMYQRPV